jgi:hypothetical protein
VNAYTEMDTVQFSTALERRMVEQLRTQKFCFASGAALRDSRFFAESSWVRFSECWARLTLDRHMADHGTYRFRRYGAYELEHPSADLVRLPHAPYEQPKYINPLNGGVSRSFDPLEDEFWESPLLRGLLRSLARVFWAVLGSSAPWNIRLHPYRIVAGSGTPGKPTPEGLHRDGVDFIVTLMVKRQNVQGGQTVITDQRGDVLMSRALLEPLDIVVADDAATMHSVTAIGRDDAESDAFRDVLVVAYTAIADTSASR